MERVEAAFDGPLTESDLPEGHADSVAYFTDDEGEWEDLRYARSLLRVHGPVGPAWVALRELDVLERKIEALNEEYLRLWGLARSNSENGPGGLWEAERLAAQVESGAYPDNRLFDSIRAQIVTLALECETSEPEK